VSPASSVNVPVKFTGVFTEKIEPLAKVADQLCQRHAPHDEEGSISLEPAAQHANAANVG